MTSISPPDADTQGAGFDRVVAALEEGGWIVGTPSDDRASARCPAHDDQQASLGIVDTGSRAWVTCFAGCEWTEVLDALGLVEADLLDQPRSQPRPLRPYREERRWRLVCERAEQQARIEARPEFWLGRAKEFDAVGSESAEWFAWACRSRAWMLS